MGKLSTIVLSILLTVLIFNVELSSCELENIYNWKMLDFAYPSDAMREEQVRSGAFKPRKLVLTGVDIWKNKLFLALKQTYDAVPATLTYIDLNDKSGNQSPKLIPYPDWASHQKDRNDSRLISVSRIHVDDCDRLWMVDTGFSEFYSRESKQIRTPRILVFDLNTDKLIDERTLTGVYGRNLRHIMVDVTKNNCDNAFAYAPHADAGIIVYDFKNKDSWLYLPQYAYSKDGALSAVNGQGYRTLYSNPPVKDDGYPISTKLLRNKTVAADGQYSKPNGGINFVPTIDEKTGVIFYIERMEGVLHCWNSLKPAASNPHTTATVISMHENRTEGTPTVDITDATVDGNGTLWIIGHIERYDSMIDGLLKPRHVVSKVSVADLIKGTACDA